MLAQTVGTSAASNTVARSARTLRVSKDAGEEWIHDELSPDELDTLINEAYGQPVLEEHVGEKEDDGKKKYGLSTPSSIREPAASEGLACFIFEDDVLHNLWIEAARKTSSKDLLVSFATELNSRLGKGKSQQPLFEDSNGLDVEEENHGLMGPDSFQAFVERSRAFQTFRMNVEKFVRPIPTQPASRLQKCKDILYALSEGLVNPMCAIFKYLGKYWNRLIKGPPVEEGFTRIMWTCSCGTTLYDDYDRTESSAAEEFHQLLQRQSRRKSAPLNHHLVFRQLAQFIGRLCNSIAAAILILPTYCFNLYRKVFHRTPNLPTHELEAQQPPSQATSQRPAPPEQLYLLLCIDDGSRSSVIRAYQPAVHDIDSDNAFFNMLHRYHASTKKRWWSWLSMREIKDIYFVSFDLYERSIVDIKEINAMPTAEYNTAYRYESTNVKPPIGSRTLKHFLRYPEHASAELAPCLQKVPKKLNDRLIPCPTQGVSPGWGLHFEDGWSWKKILTIICSLFLLASILEGALYSRLQHNVQDAMALGAFMLACFSIVIATLQAWLMIA
ncbi:uncharacterized protein LY89DRAFT_789126 [Mollisia scopiformis]|uniref:Uncharacterized protein n=1 Tax=Mollisia scopiformis TaxID=149040 RepID=A0A132B8W1_MOLSC|nr:uncharacterized protein LY89DRAFT_789126 [Mollisia scopiformis]KUJ08314.1 hypothetical protein LY89DRAFT_789126 [Mollisia scopiformis]